MDLRLASTSPRRRELLEEAGIPFTVVPTDAREEVASRDDPHRLARRNALLKAGGAQAPPGAIVLAADTVVATGVAGEGEILGKPQDDADATRMLRILSGTTHRVVTAVAVRAADTRCGSVETRVTMRVVGEDEISAYVATGDSRDKAGGYGIQSGAGGFVTELQGPYDNVVGLPVDLVRDLLRQCRGDVQ